MAASNNLNQDQIIRSLRTVNTKINNLEAKYGGFINAESSEPWKSKKAKLMGHKSRLLGMMPPVPQEDRAYDETGESKSFI